MKFSNLILMGCLISTVGASEYKCPSLSKRNIKLTGAKMLPYGTAFGKRDNSPNETFIFCDFELKFLSQRPLNEEEKKRKAQSIKEGYDGGDSMLNPFNRFELKNTEGKITEFELSIVPYARYTFEVKNSKFLIKNAQHPKEGWVITEIKD
jgi:hypothetical protein